MTRGISQHDDQAWMLFMPDEDVAAFAVMESIDTIVIQRRVVVKTQKYAAGDPRKTIWINGPQDVAADTTGIATMALGYPAVALGSGGNGAHVGPYNGSWELSAGYPGFVVVGSGPASGTVVVIQRPVITICRGLAKGAVEAAAASYTVDNVTAETGLTPVASSSDELTVYVSTNTNAPAIDDNANVRFHWSDADNKWYQDDAECPA